MMAEKHGLGWYGKIPAAGDFLQQGVDEYAVHSWSSWFQSGLVNWHLEHVSQVEPYSLAPIWNFALPATLGVQRAQIGCLMPSHDRVGRFWPLLAVQSVPLKNWHPAQLAIAGNWFTELGSVMLQAVQELHGADWLEHALRGIAPLPRPGTARSAILDVLGYQDQPCTLSWCEVAGSFDPLQFTSYWWTNQSDGNPPINHKHSGILTARLFTQLLHPTAGTQTGQRKFYPAMFE